MANKEKLKTDVQRGTDLLDKLDPKWHEKISLERLNMDSCLNCVLGQLYGLYSEGLLKVKCVSTEQGFNYKPEISRDPVFTKDYVDDHRDGMNYLTELWTDVIKQRRASTEALCQT